MIKVAMLFVSANYEFNPYAIPVFAAALAISLLGIGVLVHERASRVSVSFFLVTQTTALWLFCFSWMYSAKEEVFALMWAKAAYLALPFLPSAIFKFTGESLHNNHERYKRFVDLSWVLSSFFVIVILTTNVLIAGLYHYPWGYYPRYGWLSIPFLIFFFGMIMASLHCFYVEYRKAESGTYKERIKSLMIAFAFGYVASVDYFAKFGIPVYPFGYVFVFCFLALAARTIWRYHLIDITPSMAAAQISATMKDLLIICDNDGLIQTVNKAMRSKCGYGQEELIGKPISELIVDSNNEFIKPAFLLRQQMVKDQEMIFCTKGGEQFHVSVAISPFEGPDHTPIGFVLIARDITMQKRAEAVSKLAAIVEHSDDAIISNTLEHGLITSWNKGAEHIYGYTASEVLGRPISILASGGHNDEMYRNLEQIKMGHHIDQREIMHIKKDGTQIYVSLSISPIKDMSGKVIGASAIARDITERKRAEAALQEAHEKLKVSLRELEERNREFSILTAMNELLQSCITKEEACKVIERSLKLLFPDAEGAIYFFRPSQNILEMIACWGSQSLEQVFGREDCLGLRQGRFHLTQVTGEPKLELCCKHLQQLVRGDYLCIPMMAQGETLGVLCLRKVAAESVLKGKSENSEPYLPESKQNLALAVAEPIALALANLKLRETLLNQAICDPLTGLFNRRYLEEYLERELQRAIRNNRSVGIILLDIDNFKKFNNTFGHEAGDALLSAFGKFLQGRIRGFDFVCRYGGEEFLIIMPEVSLEGTLKRAEELCEAVKQMNMEHRGQQLDQITLSAGVSVFPQNGSTREVLLRAADEALYRAKAEGRDQAVA